VGNVLIGLQISLEHKTNAHSVTSSLCHVDWSSDCASELELVCFDWHDLNERHLLDKLLGSLVVEAVLVSVPSGTLDEHTLDVGSVFNPLGDGGGISLFKHNCVQSRLVQRPSLASASLLH
jgi:hypothetical protein